MSDNHFVVPLKYYIGTFVALLFLTVATVYTVEMVDLGKFNIVLAMFIAGLKGTLVVTFFMGLRWDKGFNIAIILGALVFLLIFFTIVFVDVGSRGYVIPEEGQRIDLNTPVKLDSGEKLNR